MGFIKKLIGGIFAFLSGLFGKKSEYYVELDEKDVKPIEAAKSVAPEPAKALEPAPAPEPVKVETKAETNGKVNGKVEAPAPVAVAKPEPAPVAASSGDATFAPKFLAPTSTNGRRRPGPSLSPFLDMAKQVKS